MKFDPIARDVRVPALEALTLKFLFDDGHLILCVERGYEGEREPTPSGTCQLGMQLTLAQAYGCDQI